MACTNPNTKKSNDTNNDNLFSINNVAENVVAHVRINGQMVKDLKPMGALARSFGVVFLGAQDYRAYFPSISLGATTNQRIQV